MHSISERDFYGNTSMNPEMGFLMAGQALVRLVLLCYTEG